MFKKVFCLECGLNVCENERGYSWNNRSTNFEAVWEICLIKCDFTTEIQPWTAESRIEPVSVGVVLIKKTRKIYISHICYVSERSFYKIHASEKLPLNYAFVKSNETLFDRTSSVSQYETQTFDNRLKTTLTLEMSRSDIIRTSDSRPNTWQLWKDLTKQFLLH